MFALRDALASVLLGVQAPSNDSQTDLSTAAKKSKKKAHKKKSKKPKPEVKQQQEDDDDNDYESLSDASEAVDFDDEELIPGVGAALTQSSSESSKIAAALIYQYESTQLGKSALNSFLIMVYHYKHNLFLMLFFHQRGPNSCDDQRNCRRVKG